MNILFLISGIGLLNKKVWARKMALVVLVISPIYSANCFAWGFTGGTPSSTVQLISLLVVGLWNGLWFYLVYKVKPTEMITENRYQITSADWKKRGGLTGKLLGPAAEFKRTRPKRRS